MDNNRTPLFISLFVLSFYYAVVSSLFLALFLAGTAAYVASSWKSSLFRKDSYERSDILLLLFFLSSLVSGILSRDIPNAVGASFAFTGYFIIMIVFRGQRKNIGTYYPSLMKALALGLLVFSVIHLLLYFVIRKDIMLVLFNQMLFLKYDPSMIVGFFQWAARGGYILSILVLIITSYFISPAYKKTTYEKVLYPMAFITGCLTLLFTFSRGGLILFTVGMAVIFIFNRKWKTIVAGLSIAALLGIVLMVSVHNKLIKQPEKLLVNKISSVETRINQYKWSLDRMSRQDLFMGTGLMNFRVLYKDIEQTDYLHNAYLAILFETGISGFILFFMFIILKTFVFLKSSIRDQDLHSITALSLVSGFLVTSMFDAMLLYAFPIGVLLWMAIGLAGRSSHNLKKEQNLL